MKAYLKTLALLLVSSLAMGQTSIYNIQFTEDSSGDSPLADSDVTTSGLVVATSEDGYWIVDGLGSWSGLFIFDFDNTPAIGDSVTVSGTVQEFYDLTELSFVSSFEVTSSENALPDPIEVSTADLNLEDYEGCYVKAVEAECTNADSGFGQWIINDGSGEVFVNPEIYDYDAVQGTFYNIVGVMSYSFDERKLFPRSAEDVEVFVGIEESSTPEINIYPNPVIDFVTVDLPTGTQAQYSVFTIDGKLVIQDIISDLNNKVDLSTLENGVYVMNINSEGLSFSKRFEKK